MLNVLVSTISNSQVLLLNKLICLNAKAFSKILAYISVYAIFNNQSFNDTFTNDIISFEQLGPDYFKIYMRVMDEASSSESS